MSKLAGESFAAPASAKQQPVHCAAMIARKFNDKNADTDYHAVPPAQITELEATLSVKTGASNILKQSP